MQRCVALERVAVVEGLDAVHVVAAHAVAGDDLLICRFRMPFAKQAVVTIARDDAGAIAVSGAADVKPAPFGKNRLLFQFSRSTRGCRAATRTIDTEEAGGRASSPTSAGEQKSGQIAGALRLKMASRRACECREGIWCWTGRAL